MRTNVSMRPAITSMVLVLALAVSACAAQQATPPQASATPASAFDPRSGTEVLGLDASAAQISPTLVVLVPGGAWTSADPSGLVPLAESLVTAGAIAAITTYRTASDGVFFPEPARDVACSVAAAVAIVGESGREVDDVVLLGHSAGAHLAALVALRGTEFADGCPDPPVAADALVGLAGLYDVTQVPLLAPNLFGPSSPDPSDREQGNPVGYAAARPQMPVLLVHGTADGLVPVQLTTEFADALSTGGHAVSTDYPAGVDHQSVYSAEVAGPVVAAWLDL